MSKNDCKDWLNRFFFTTKIGKNINQRLNNQEKRLKQLENKQALCNQSHIDLEMFGIKLFKAKLINATKGIIISLILIGIVLLFIFYYFQ